MDKEETLRQFMDITLVNVIESVRMLELGNWNLQLALTNFFASLNMADGNNLGRQATNEKSHKCRSGETHPCGQPPAPRPPQSCLRMGTIIGICRERSCRDGQPVSAGGSENNGQQVLGPEPNDELFRTRKNPTSQLLEGALEQATTDNQASNDALHTGGNAFQGADYHLGQRLDDTVLVPSLLRRPGDNNRRRDVTLRLWREGFSVDEGPLREYNGQENTQFINEISRGYIPSELLHEAQGGTVYLITEDHRHKSYVQTKSKVRAFAGNQGTTESRPAGPNNNVIVDPAFPTTNIEIRLSDGSTMQATMNCNHTITDVHRFIVNNRPELADKAFTFLISFPSGS